MSNESKATDSLGNGVKGVFNAIHGAGEVIRGTFNDGADAIGEGIANDGKSVGKDGKRQEDLAMSGHAPQDHSATVAEGKQQVQQGVGALGGNSEKKDAADLQPR